MTLDAATAPAPAGIQTIRWVEWVYGSRGEPRDDPAEEYHEASKVAPRIADMTAPGSRLLEVSSAMRVTAARSVKRYGEAPVTPLPAHQLPPVPLRSAIAQRRSERAFGPGPIELGDLGLLLDAGYGVTATLPPGQPVRAVPSGGALYPLELYVAAARVRGLGAAIFHFDPFRRVLERLSARAGSDALAALSPYGSLLADAAAVIFVTGMFWRTRFKYGLRGYRFCLLEAGHVAQNMLLAATALGLASLPVGGLYDRRVDELLGVDGVNESVVYAISVGTRAA